MGSTKKSNQPTPTQKLTAECETLIKTMKGPSTVERDKAVARLANKLDMCNQYAKCFGL